MVGRPRGSSYITGQEKRFDAELKSIWIKWVVGGTSLYSPSTTSLRRLATCFWDTSGSVSCHGAGGPGGHLVGVGDRAVDGAGGVGDEAEACVVVVV